MLFPNKAKVVDRLRRVYSTKKTPPPSILSILMATVGTSPLPEFIAVDNGARRIYTDREQANPIPDIPAGYYLSGPPPDLELGYLNEIAVPYWLFIVIALNGARSVV